MMSADHVCSATSILRTHRTTSPLRRSVSRSSARPAARLWTIFCTQEGSCRQLHFICELKDGADISLSDMNWLVLTRRM